MHRSLPVLPSTQEAARLQGPQWNVYSIFEKGVKLKFSASTKGSEMRKFQGFPIVADDKIPYSEHTLGYDHDRLELLQVEGLGHVAHALPVLGRGPESQLGAPFQG